MDFVKLDAQFKPLTAAWSAVLDPATNLIWMRDTLPGGRMTKAKAEEAIKALGDGWRLPTIQELLSLVDYTRTQPAIDTAFFPDTKSDWYWTSSPFVGVSGFSWIVTFSNGYSSDLPHDLEAFVRPVRSAPAAGAGQ